MTKRISKKLWTGFNAYKKWSGKLQEAKKFYESNNINLKEDFYKGWDMGRQCMEYINPPKNSLMYQVG